MLMIEFVRMQRESIALMDQAVQYRCELLWVYGSEAKGSDDQLQIVGRKRQ